MHIIFVLTMRATSVFKKVPWKIMKGSKFQQTPWIILGYDSN